MGIPVRARGRHKPGADQRMQRPAQAVGVRHGLAGGAQTAALEKRACQFMSLCFHGPETLLEAIRKVSKTGKYISTAMAEKIAFLPALTEQNPIERLLSERERQIFRLIAAGKNIKEISQKLAISNKTVSTHKFNLMSKLGLKSVAELVRYSIQEKL